MVLRLISLSGRSDRALLLLYPQSICLVQGQNLETSQLCLNLNPRWSQIGIDPATLSEVWPAWELVTGPDPDTKEIIPTLNTKRPSVFSHDTKRDGDEKE